jgi:small subunit ribosomal protein S1
VGHNRGGLLVRVDGLEAFLPNSLCSQLPRGAANDLARAKADLVGQPMPVKVIEVNTDRRRLVVSEKAARRESRDQLLAELRAGMTRTGTVTGLTDFGAFVDIGGADGLVHISELAWHFVDHPSEVLKIGEQVEVEVLSVDIERSRIGLSRKRCLPEPWVGVDERYQIGQVVAGRVKARTGVGLIVVLADGVEGLVRPEDLEPAEATDPQAVGQPGQWASLRIQGMDYGEQRLRLSLELQAQEA